MILFPPDFPFRRYMLALSHCNKIPKLTDFKEETFCFASCFQRFQSVGPVATQYVMVGACSREGLFASWWPGSKETERQCGPQHPIQGHMPNDLTFSH